MINISSKLFSLKKQPDRKSDRGYEESLLNFLKYDINKEVLYCTTSNEARSSLHCDDVLIALH